jgi:hypothetical protein
MKKTFSVNWQFKEQNFNAIDQVPEIKNPVLIICPECEMDYVVEIANYLLDNIKGSTPADTKKIRSLSPALKRKVLFLKFL